SMAALIEDGADFVTGDRLSDAKEGAMRDMHLVGNQILSITARLLFQLPIRDSQSGMWVFRKDILGALDMVSDGMAYSEEIKIEAHRRGFRLGEVSIPYRSRVGEAKIRSVADAWKNLLFLFKKRFGWTGKVD
ncbi:MAG: glycosyltransferase family 2 protein, partial [Thermoplasmata archaeon]